MNEELLELIHVLHEAAYFGRLEETLDLLAQAKGHSRPVLD